MKDILWRKTSNCTWILLLTLTLVSSSVNIMAETPSIKSDGTAYVKVIPSTVEFKSGNATGQEFDIAVVVENVTNLYGVTINMTWDTTYLEYVSHTFTMPVQDYPSPISPSPYAGLLRGPLLTITEQVDAVNGWIACDEATMGVPPPPSFNGSGTAFVMTLRVKYHPQDVDTVTLLHLVTVELAGKMPPGPLIIPHVDTDGTVILRSYFAYPPLPLLDLRVDGAKEYTAFKKNENFTVSIWLMAEGEGNLSSFWDVSGFDMTLNFNATLIKATSITIDPANWWKGFYPGGVQVLFKDMDNTLGRARIAFLGLPALNGTHTAPYGKGILANVTFTAIYESAKYPPPECKIWLENPLSVLSIKKLYSDGGPIDLADPLGTDWHELTPAYDTKYNLTAWEDIDGDGKLSANDQIRLFDYTAGKWLPYKVYTVPVTMNVTITPFDTQDEFVEGSTMFTNTWPYGSSWPNPTAWPPTYKNVTLSLTYSATAVASVQIEYPNGTGKVLTEGTEWKWLGGNKLQLIEECFGVPRSVTFVEGVNLTTGYNGYVPYGIVDVPNKTTGWVHRWIITPVKDRLDLYWGVYDSNDSAVARNYVIYLDSNPIESGTLTWEGSQIDMYTLINDMDAGDHNLTITIDNPDDTYMSTYMDGYLFYGFEDEIYGEANVSVSYQFELDFTAAPPTLTVLPWKVSSGYLWMNVDGEAGWGYNVGYDYFQNNPTCAIAPTWNYLPSDRFPLGTEVRIDYMAEGTKLWVNYTGVEPTKWLESELYAGDFPMSSPVGTSWGEILPDNTREFTIVAWTDVDTNGKLSSGDTITIKNTATNVTRIATVSFVATGLSVIQKPVVCMGNIDDEFYGFYTVVDVAGYPHPERALCPWHNHPYSVPLPHVITEPVIYTAPTLAPVALFAYTPSEPVQREEITFDASMSYSPVNKTIISYAWDFGDGSTGTGKTTTHKYMDSGTYTVTLIVTDEDYVNSSAFVDFVYVAPWPSPIAIFTYSPTMPVDYENIVFNASLSYSPQGAEIISYAWDFGDGATGTGETITHKYLSAGSYEVTLTVTDAFDFNGSTVGSVFVNRGLMTLDVEADVGSIHFTGEVAEFHALVKFIGEPINATKISAKLYGPNDQIVAYYRYPTNITLLSTGLYKVSYTVGAAEGTYTLVVEVEYYTLKASTLRSFLVSVTLTGWDAMIKDIKNEIATIVIPSIGEIKLNLTDIKAKLVSVEGTVGVINSTVGQIKTNLALINATLTDIIVDSKGEILAKIDTALGTVTTKLDTINAKVVAIDGNVVTIKTSVGEIETSIGDVQTALDGLQSTVTIGLAAASILSAVAAILAAIILLMLRKK